MDLNGLCEENNDLFDKAFDCASRLGIIGGAVMRWNW